MAKFVFKLEAVLKQRKMAEDQRQRDLAKSLRQRMILHDQVRHMQDSIRQSRRSLSDGLIGRIDLEQIAHFARYSGQVRQRANAIVQKLAEVEKQIESARQLLVIATRDRRAIELLRDRQLRQWQQEQERRETAMLDELATQRFARRMALGLIE